MSVATTTRWGLAAVGAAAVGVVAGRLVEAAWRKAPDPTGVDGMTLPAGTERVVRTDDGAELAVTVCGPDDGPVVVLAHGWLCARRMWGPVARLLVDTGHRVVVYDQRGHADSTPGTAEPTVARLGDDLATILDQLDLHDVVLVGHSMGGFGAMAFACDHLDMLRERVRGLLLVSTAANGLGFGRRGDALVVRLLRSELMRSLAKRPNLGLWMVRGGVGRRPRANHLAFTRELITAMDSDQAVACFLGFGAMDHRPGLAKIEVPTAILVGKFDTLTPPRFARVIAAAIPGATLEVVPDGGHMLPFEVPERIAELAQELSTV